MTTPSRRYVEWQADCSLDLPEIDAQHMALFDTINRLWTAVTDAAGPRELAKVIEELERYTQTHFSAEETLMRMSGYPRFEAHKAEHATFIGRLAQEKARVDLGQPVTLDMLGFLNDWLVSHICQSDKDYARHHIAQATPRALLAKVFTRFWV